MRRRRSIPGMTRSIVTGMLVTIMGLTAVMLILPFLGTGVEARDPPPETLSAEEKAEQRAVRLARKMVRSQAGWEEAELSHAAYRNQNGYSVLLSRTVEGRQEFQVIWIDERGFFLGQRGEL
jgi:hypothetical protein